MKLMARMRKRRFGRLRSSRGSTLVEAALITPLLLLLTFSIVDFGALLYIYLSLESGVSQATRFAVTGSQSPGLKPRTVRYIHTILHAALDDAVRWRKVPLNAADQATPPSAKSARAPEMRTWSAP